MSAAPASAPDKSGWAEIGLIGFIFSVLLWMILPLRPWMLDILLALSISSGLLVMLVIIYIREPSEFTSFPTLLLIITLFRLGINVASTRLILGEAQAGQIAGIYYTDDLIAEPMRLIDGAIEVPHGPGMGIEIDEAKIEKYRLED